MDAMEQHRWTQFLAAVRREIPSWESAAADAQSEIARLRVRVEELEAAGRLITDAAFVSDTQFVCPAAFEPGVRALRKLLPGEAGKGGG